MSGTCCISLITSPLKVGYHSKENLSSTSNRNARNGNSTPYQDGFISAWVSFIALAAIAASVTVSQWLTQEQTISIGKTTVQTGLSFLMLICVVAFLVLLCSGRVRSQVTQTTPSSTANGNGQCRQVTKTILPFIGIVIFLIGSIAYDILEILANSFCIESFSSLEYYSYSAIVSVAYHTLKIHFTTLLAIFCGVFAVEGIKFYR